jgi:hypothetical protein
LGFVGEQVIQLGLQGTGMTPQVLLGSKTAGAKQEVHVVAVPLQVLQFKSQPQFLSGRAHEIH